MIVEGMVEDVEGGGRVGAATYELGRGMWSKRFRRSCDNGCVVGDRCHVSELRDVHIGVFESPWSVTHFVVSYKIHIVHTLHILSSR
jgi:hypothetical protein